ncbi:hypothetical protein HZS_442, partial [Henneguya salminicola]
MSNVKTDIAKGKAYSVTEKFEAVSKVMNGECQAKVLRELGMSDSTLRGLDQGRIKTAGI